LASAAATRGSSQRSWSGVSCHGTSRRDPITGPRAGAAGPRVGAARSHLKSKPLFMARGELPGLHSLARGRRCNDGVWSRRDDGATQECDDLGRRGVPRAHAPRRGQRPGRSLLHTLAR
jgi:hypothetical protein